jgi:hypothetical protein
VNVHPAPYEDDEPSGYDYENDKDASEYCSNVVLVSTVNSALKLLSSDLIYSGPCLASLCLHGFTHKN